VNAPWNRRRPWGGGGGGGRGSCCCVTLPVALRARDPAGCCVQAVKRRVCWCCAAELAAGREARRPDGQRIPWLHPLLQTANRAVCSTRGRGRSESSKRKRAPVDAPAAHASAPGPVEVRALLPAAHQISECRSRRTRHRSRPHLLSCPFLLRQIALQIFKLSAFASKQGAFHCVTVYPYLLFDTMGMAS